LFTHNAQLHRQTDSALEVIQRIRGYFYNEMQTDRRHYDANRPSSYCV